MRQIITLILFMGLMAGCNNADPVDKKKARYEKVSQKIDRLNKQLASLEDEIREEDPSFNIREQKRIPVTVYPAQPSDFSHYVEVTGIVSSEENVDVTSEMPGRIVSINVQEGEVVSKGELLISLEATTIERNLKALETQLELATTLFERQKNLWEQNVGTEVQYLQSKASKEQLESQVAATRAQLRQMRIYAPFNGTVDNLNAKIGQNAQPGVPLLRLVSLDENYIEAGVSEEFLGSFNSGDSVVVSIPNQQKEFVSTIASVGKVLNFDNRTFNIRVSLPAGMKNMNPNMITVIKLKDRTAENALTIPSYLLQQDAKGSFVFKVNDDRAHKVYVETGFSYANKTLITKGIKPGDRLVDEGFREVTEDALVEIVEETV